LNDLEKFRNHVQTEIYIFLFVAFGISHEWVIYWLQSKYFIYSRLFNSKAFIIHSIQLGFVWILIGTSITFLLFQITDGYKYHHSSTGSIIGFSFLCLGLSIMWVGFQSLGWERMMKIRLFAHPEATWVKTGIFNILKNPMYRGSQLSMIGISLILDSWVILLYSVEMVLLQQILVLLERKPISKKLADYLALNYNNSKS
jgi:protein-S-isoprenylcysteine O-methyltransferase Ste14